MCKNCNRLICQKCIDIIAETIEKNNEDNSKCLKCLNDLNLVDLHNFMKKGLDNLNIKCPSNDLNCLEEIKIKDIFSHLETCKYYEGNSRCLGCGFVDTTKNIENHVETCFEFEEKCQFCGLLFKKKLLFDHEITCSKMPDKCKICSVKIKEDNYKLHPIDNVCIINAFKNVKKDYESIL